MDIFGVEFPKDYAGNDSIRDNWIADMKHFCQHFVRPKGNFKTEELVIYKLSDDRYIQGYIDLIRENEDGSISIYDWKTSTNFKSADLVHHGRQLALYALAKEAEGYTVRNVAWIMLKYCTVTFWGKKRVNSKKKSEIKKVVNRGKLVKELAPYIMDDLIELGYDREKYINEMWQQKTLDVLPADVLARYEIKPYVRQYEITDKVKQETINYINRMADLFESLDTKDSKQWKPKVFTKINPKGKEVPDTFFCGNLCNHRESCKHYLNFIKEWDEKMKIDAEFDDLF